MVLANFPARIRRRCGGFRRGPAADAERTRASARAQSPAALAKLERVATDSGSLFAELVGTVRVANFGQIVNALFEAGDGERRSRRRPECRRDPVRAA
jgi:hypothetical protein